jgi:hypothetical protein
MKAEGAKLREQSQPVVLLRREWMLCVVDFSSPSAGNNEAVCSASSRCKGCRHRVYYWGQSRIVEFVVRLAMC